MCWGGPGPELYVTERTLGQVRIATAGGDVVQDEVGVEGLEDGLDRALDVAAELAGLEQYDVLQLETPPDPSAILLREMLHQDGSRLLAIHAREGGERPPTWLWVAG